MLLPFVTLMGVATIQAFAGTPTPLADRLPALLVLTAAAIAIPVAMALAASSILDQARAIEADRSELVELYDQARVEATIDGLTSLGNHRAFQDELARQLAAIERSDAALALLLVDVDDLKTVNDNRGHVAGDDLLVTMGRIVSTNLRSTDRAFRVGGDEFAILLTDADLDTGIAVARRILAAALSGGGDASEGVEPFSLSIGVSAVPAPTSDPRLLYRNADAALYWGKRHGRTAVVAYDPRLHGDGNGPRPVAELAAGIEAVIASRAVTPVYQPIFSMETGLPIGYEGLVRPTAAAPFGDPGSMFMAAEAAGRTVELDLLCLETVAAGVGTLEEGVYISVNLSPRTLESQLFRAGELKAIFHRNGIRLHEVVLELTEREPVEDLDQLRKNVAACRRAGMRIAADDVGAGNAGLRLLSEVSFEIVKIDLSLVQGVALHDPSHAVLRALQELASQWKATVVAEGVETAEQLATIRELGIKAGQGYLLGRPIPTRESRQLDLDELSGVTAAADESPTPYVLAPSAVLGRERLTDVPESSEPAA
ncbi:MAG TPA: EAL domain-containing protein [Candidatus Limnocylindrales bacterium]|jgi:diguanylate cyclase (GGDEF)-like protein